MAAYSPPFTLTHAMPCHAMLSRVAEIAELVGQWRFAQSSQVPCCVPNRICTIQAEGLLRAHGLLMRGRCDDANHPGHVLETVFEFVIWINL